MPNERVFEKPQVDSLGRYVYADGSFVLGPSGRALWQPVKCELCYGIFSGPFHRCSALEEEDD